MITRVSYLGPTCICLFLTIKSCGFIGFRNLRKWRIESDRLKITSIQSVGLCSFFVSLSSRIKTHRKSSSVCSSGHQNSGSPCHLAKWVSKRSILQQSPGRLIKAKSFCLSLSVWALTIPSTTDIRHHRPKHRSTYAQAKHSMICYFKERIRWIMQAAFCNAFDIFEQPLTNWEWVYTVWAIVDERRPA